MGEMFGTSTIVTLAICGCAARPTVQSIEPTDLSISAEVVHKKSAFFVKVTLANNSHSLQVWINGRMEWSLEPISSLQLTVFDRSGRPVDPGVCFVNVGLAQPSDYVLLKPGQRIVRLAPLPCFNLNSLDMAGLEVSYEDHNSTAPPTPDGAIRFRAKLQTKRVWFAPQKMALDEARSAPP